MKYLNKLATVFCSAALGLMSLTSCEGGDLFSINGPDWMAERIDSIANAKSQGGEEEEEIEGMHEDVYNIGKEDLTAGFWTLGKTYVVPAGEKWIAQFNLTVNPDNKYYKNFYVVLNAFNGDIGDEYGVIRFDNDPTKNSEWNTVGEEINRDLIGGNFQNTSGDDDIDASVQKMNGKITLTIDRADGGLYIEMTNGDLTKTYTQNGSFPSTGADIDMCFRVGVEGSLVSFLGSTIEPIGGYTSKEDKQPVSLEVSGVPGEVLIGTPLQEAMANVVGVVTFTEGVTKTVTAADLEFKTIPDYESLGQKTLVAVYNKTFKGELSSTTAVAVKTFSVVNELSAYTQTVVVPDPLVLGAEDNSQAWWTVHTENIKVDPKETKVINFTNYTSGVSNWNNFVIVLNKADLTEYAVVRADNWGWGDGYGACKTVGGFSSDEEWATWLAAMDGAKVTAYITNNGDGTADVKAVMKGNNGVEYVQEYNGINTIDPDDMYFRFTVDGSHIVFDNELGAPDCSTPWWTDFTQNVQVRAHQVCTVNFTNYTSGANNWNNFVVILNKEDLTEYAVVRADNYGWGNGYDACTHTGGFGSDEEWAAWRSVMDGAKCTVQIVNNGDGTADIKCVMHGTDGVDYLQDYIGINTIDPDNFFFRFTVDGSHIVFE
jgi:hypothetical protein